MATEPNQRSYTRLLRYIAEGTILTWAVAGMLATVAAAIYHCSSSTGPSMHEYTGKIIDKRISVYESQEGSSFVREVIVEERNGVRFPVSVTRDVYERAKPGMWIQRTSRGIQLVPNPEENFTHN